MIAPNSWLFQITKIQNFETNSQLRQEQVDSNRDCFRSQRYKILKPIHNEVRFEHGCFLLFQITKIQNFETNSQHLRDLTFFEITVSDHKDTKFWNQFTTCSIFFSFQHLLFQITKIQNFETNSQQVGNTFGLALTVSDHKDTKFWNQFTTWIHYNFF